MSRIINFLIINILIINNISGQEQASTTSLPIDEDTKLITYQEVVQETGTKDELFNRAVMWINFFYKNPVDVTKVRDPESGIIKGLHRFKIYKTDKKGNKTDAGVIMYSINLQFKEGRYRYTITDFILKQSSRFPIERWLNKDHRAYNSNWDDYLNQVNIFTNSLIKSLKKGMKPENKKTDDDW
ncbi:MAG: DUF4468 domain-containing protein [Bacteroidales bacterium]|nr:DUF4468 domain-containing protein [Bacteroidales bacterium]